MRSLSSAAVAALSTIILTQVVSAADLPIKAPAAYIPPQPAPVIKWTGCYGGLNAGGAFPDNSADVTTTNTFNNTAVLSPLGLTYGTAAAAATTGSFSSSKAGFIGGGQLGCNWQFAPNWVTGFEADFQGLSQNYSAGSSQVAVRDAAFPGLNVDGNISVSQKLDYIGTVRGRIGPLISPAWWIYATGGLAYGKESATTSLSGGENPNTGSTDFATTGSLSKTGVGWTVGGGVEWMFAPRWSAKFEYLYYDLGDETYSNGQQVSYLNGTNTITFINSSSTTVHYRGSIFRAGINFQFY